MAISGKALAFGCTVLALSGALYAALGQQAADTPVNPFLHDPAAIAQGISAVRGAGTVVLVGMSPKPTQVLPTATIASRELVVTGVFRYANTWPTAISLASSGRVNLDALVTGRYGLDRVVEALESTHQPQTLKSMVVPSMRG